MTSAGGVVTGDTSGKGCPGGDNHVEWFTHPDGSPGYGRSLLGW
ncbi:hypothetical protein [Rhodanobacter sp. 115]|nr:hypothetical protein [Rhodanobacter sp. 115]